MTAKRPFLAYGSEDIDGRFCAALAASSVTPGDAADAVGVMAARGDTILTFRDLPSFQAWQAKAWEIRIPTDRNSTKD